MRNGKISPKKQGQTQNSMFIFIACNSCLYIWLYHSNFMQYQILAQPLFLGVSIPQNCQRMIFLDHFGSKRPRNGDGFYSPTQTLFIHC